MAITMKVLPYNGFVDGRPFAGAAYLKVTGGTPGNRFEVMRVSSGFEPNKQLRFAVKPIFDANGEWEGVDAECGFGWVEYFIKDNQGVRGTAFILAPRLGPEWRQMRNYEGGVLRQIVHPRDKWEHVVVQDELDIRYENRSGVFNVTSRPDPVVVSDRRVLPQSTVVFLVPSIAHADRLLEVLDATLPLLLMTPCDSLIRDRCFIPLDVVETRWGKQGWRLIAVDTQTVPLPEGDLFVPDADLQRWNYGLLAANTTLPQYDRIAPAAIDPNDYAELAADVIP